MSNYENLSLNDKFVFFGIQTIVEDGKKYLIYQDKKIIRPEFGTLGDIKKSINRQFNINLDIKP